jgi:YD repeat-containing protein
MTSSNQVKRDDSRDAAALAVTWIAQGHIREATRRGSGDTRDRLAKMAL